jgi:hypothetical protein
MQMVGGHGSKMNRKMEAAIAALLTHRTIEEAAKAANIGTQTLLRWMKLPEFDAEYRKVRRMAFRQAVSRLQQASGAAATTLTKVMVDPASPPAVKIRAAELVLTHGLKAIEVEDIEARVSELERAKEESNQTR